MKKLYVNGKLVALGNYTIHEVNERQKYSVKVFRDYDYEPCMFGDSGVTTLSNHRDFAFDGEVTEEALKNIGKEVDGKKYFPVYMLDHSGYTLSEHPFNDRWDSGLLGVVIVDSKIGDPDALFRAHFAELKAVMEGDVYGFQILNELGEVVDSCGGFFGKDMLDFMYEYISPEYRISREDLENAFK